MSENYDVSEEKFISILDEARAIFTKKSKEVQELQEENKKFRKEIEELERDKEKLILKEESIANRMKILEENLGKSEKDLENVTAQMTNSKKFMKKFFTELLDRMTEIKEKGIYNAEAFSYLIGDVGRSLFDTSLAGKQKKSPTKKQGVSKLSTNKEKRHFRYENISPLDLTSRTSTKRNNVLNKPGDDDMKKNIENGEPLRAKAEGNLTINIVNEPDNYLDPDLTLRSPIGPPSRTSTPQGPLDAAGSLRFEDLNLKSTGSQQISPSLISGENTEDARSSLLSRLLLLEGDIPELTEPQSPTIPSRSCSSLKNKNSDVPLEERKMKRKRSPDVTFGSLLANPQDVGLNPDCLASDTRVSVRRRLEGECRHEDGEGKPALQQPTASATLSPDIIVLNDSDFARPGTTSISRKKPKTCSVNETKPDTSSLVLFSPQCSKSPVIPTKNSKIVNESTGKIDDDDNRPRLAFQLNFDETTMEDNPPETTKRNDDQGKSYKYTEVVRGKDKRAKLNGYFCADCEKYYGSLKLSEEEIQERLQACSRHRARFSPPPSTPEHFWEVDFMNTHEYIERGFMRTESELPPEKRKLKIRKNKRRVIQ